MARRHFLKEIFNMDYSDLKKLYIEYGTIEKLSEHFGVSDRTIKNWFREGNIQGIKHPTRERKGESMDAMKRWIKANPKVKLPRKPKKISEITGIPLAAVKSFFVRRRARMLKWIERFPDLKTVHTTLKASDGSFVPTQAIEACAFKVDPYSLRIMIYGRRKTGSLFTVLLNPKKYEQLFKGESDLSTQDRSGQEHH